MHRILLLSAAVLAGCVTAAGAQQPAAQKPAPAPRYTVAGTWDGKTMTGPKDSVVATFELKATADTTGWTLKFPGRDPYAARVVAMGGDSVVTEVGPYPSVLRPGVTVTLLRTTGHYTGDTMTGTFEARYATGDVLKGKVAATRRK
jgi:hypothetical protein